jgi:hypothetical protein
MSSATKAVLGLLGALVVGLLVGLIIISSGDGDEATTTSTPVTATQTTAPTTTTDTAPTTTATTATTATETTTTTITEDGEGGIEAP